MNGVVAAVSILGGDGKHHPSTFTRRSNIRPTKVRRADAPAWRQTTVPTAHQPRFPGQMEYFVTPKATGRSGGNFGGSAKPGTVRVGPALSVSTRSHRVRPQPRTKTAIPLTATKNRDHSRYRRHATTAPPVVVRRPSRAGTRAPPPVPGPAHPASGTAFWRASSPCPRTDRVLGRSARCSCPGSCRAGPEAPAR